MNNSTTLPPELVSVLPLQGPIQKIVPLTGGLIHRTLQIQSDPGSILLQSLNTLVFPYPQGLVHNHRLLHQHFQQPQAPFSLAAPLPFRNDQWIYRDATGTSWRLSQFIEGTCTRSFVESPDQAVELARFFAAFTRFTANIDDQNWAIPIPHFHNLAFRYQQFLHAENKGIPKRIQACTSLIDALKSRKQYVIFFNRMVGDPAFPLRMMHHDAKLSNVLIDADSDRWICPIDLDTVMPGYYFSDLGDMIRSLCNSTDENATDTTPIRFRSDLYESLLSGYRIGMENTLTETEKMGLDMAGILMIYMQTLRFLTDHLKGDTYYQIEHPGQNLERAINQFTLLNALENYLQEHNRLVACT